MNIELIDIPVIHDARGNLAVVEQPTLPYSVHRVYYLYDVPSHSYRGGHAHKKCKEFLVALTGSFTVRLDDGVSSKEILLNKPNKGLLINEMVWRDLKDFSSGATCLVIASHQYDEADYIRDYAEFLRI